MACEFLTNYDTWTEAVIGSHDPETIEIETGNAYRIVYKLEKAFQEPTVRKLAEIVRTKIEEFKENMPIIMTLGNPCLKSRHWEQVSEIVGFPIKVDQYMTLAKVTLINRDRFTVDAEPHKRALRSLADSRLRPGRLCGEIRSYIRGCH